LLVNKTPASLSRTSYRAVVYPLTPDSRTLERLLHVDVPRDGVMRNPRSHKWHPRTTTFNQILSTIILSPNPEVVAKPRLTNRFPRVWLPGCAWYLPPIEANHWLPARGTAPARICQATLNLLRHSVFTFHQLFPFRVYFYPQTTGLGPRWPLSLLRMCKQHHRHTTVTTQVRLSV
jgi:hypothetical protein